MVVVVCVVLQQQRGGEREAAWGQGGGALDVPAGYAVDCPDSMAGHFRTEQVVLTRVTRAIIVVLSCWWVVVVAGME